MSKNEFRNLWHSFRLMRNMLGEKISLNWISWFSQSDRIVIEKLISGGTNDR
jgi:hypothetical protein